MLSLALNSISIAKRRLSEDADLQQISINWVFVIVSMQIEQSSSKKDNCKIIRRRRN